MDISEERAELIKKAKTTMRITTDAFDEEINDLIDAALLDLNIADVSNTSTSDPLIYRAVVTYCRIHFGQPDDYDRLKASYDEQKAQLSMASDYTDYSILESE